VGSLLGVAIVTLGLGAVFSVFGSPVPIGFKVTGWLFAAAIIGVSRYAVAPTADDRLSKEALHADQR
jgi:hypothetical protein